MGILRGTNEDHDEVKTKGKKMTLTRTKKLVSVIDCSW
jgi:hypothetical protein